MTHRIVLAGLALALAAGAGRTLTLAAPPAQAGPDPAALEVALEPYLQGLANPVAFAAPEDGTGRLFVVEKRGTIRIVKDGAVQPTPFIDLSDRVESAANERGLLGLAFHPRFPQNGVFVVGYTAKASTSPPRGAGWITYARFRVTTDPDVADPGSEQPIISWRHDRGNHNGGDVQFGPDGYLYLGTGDGGGGGDPDKNGQNRKTLLAKMLRLDIDGNSPYAVPPTNPHVGDDRYAPEIWAMGLRNPWRYTFDRATGDLYIADVGQGEWEEIDFQPAASQGGENYGWSVMEGSHCYGAATCNRDGLILPIAEYDHQDARCSVTGGYVYRGQRYPALVGAYLYADYCSGQIWAASRDAAGAWRNAEVGQAPSGARIQSFGQDAAGELYALGGNGRVYRVVDAQADDPTPTGGPTQPPTATPTEAPTEPPDTPTPGQTPSATATSGRPTNTPGPSPTPSITPTPSGRVVAVKAGDFYFEPQELAATRGEDLTIDVQNVGNAPHDIKFELLEGAVAQSPRASAGQWTQVSFTAPRLDGRYVFYCTIGQHRQRGMEGVLIVGQAGDPMPAYLPWLGRDTP